MNRVAISALLLMAFMTARPARAEQLISLGFLGGIPLTDAVNTPTQANSALQYLQSTKRYEFGASVSLNLPAGFGAEFDVLHKSFDFRQATAAATESSSIWEFPLLAKYRILPGPIRPFVEGGVSFSRITGISDLIALKNRSNDGLVLGGGVEFHLGIVQITPQIRYNNWTDKYLDLSALKSNQNQATFLVGISF